MIRTLINWHAIIAVLRLRTGVKVVVLVRRTAKRRWIIVMESPDGELAPTIVTEDWEFTRLGRFRVTAAGKRKILDFLAGVGQPCARTQLAVCAKFSTVDAYLYDVVAVDESPLSALVETHELTRQNLAVLISTGQLLSASRGFLLAFDNAVLVAEGARRRELHGKDLTSRLPQLVDQRASCGFDLLRLARRLGADHSRVRHLLDSLPDHRAVDALLYAMENDGRGMYLKAVDAKGIAKGEVPSLRVSVWTAPVGLPARSALYLDATAPRPTAQLVLPNSEHHEVSIRPENLTVVWVPIDLAKSQLENRGDGLTHNQAMLLAIRTIFDGPSTLHITHRAHNPRAGATGALAEAHAQLVGPMIHHAGTKARGSNEFSGCDTAVQDTFRVGKGPILQRAAVLEHRATELGYADEHDWEDVARRQFEVEPTIQALHRIRFNEGDACVVIVDSRHPGAMSFEVDLVIEPEALSLAAFELFGSLPREQASRELLMDLVRRAVAVRGAWLADQTFNGLFAGVLSKGPDRLRDHIGRLDLYPPHLSDAAVATASTALGSLLKHDHSNDWTAFARAFRLVVTPVRCSAPGKARLVMSLDRPTAAELDAAIEAADVDWDWYETELHGRVDLGVHQAALDIRHRVDRVADPDLLRAVAEALRKPIRGVRRRIRAIGGPDSLREAWWTHRLSVVAWLRRNISEYAEAAGALDTNPTPTPKRAEAPDESLEEEK